MIKRLEYEQVAIIYDKYLVNHFLPNEIKPLESIKAMWDKEGYFAFGYFNEENELSGYALFSHCPGEKVLLLDYLAILDDYRSRGYGSDFLKALADNLSDMDYILIETEDVNFSKNEKEAIERARRDSFYLRNHVIKTKLISDVYGANYSIWYLNCNRKAKISLEECRIAYDDIYRFMLTKKGFEEYYKVKMTE